MFLKLYNCLQKAALWLQIRHLTDWPFCTFLAPSRCWGGWKTKRWDVGSTCTPAPIPKSSMNASRGWWRIICSSCTGSARASFGRRRERVSAVFLMRASVFVFLILHNAIMSVDLVTRGILGTQLCCFVQTWPTCTPCCGPCPAGCPTWSRSFRSTSTTRASEAPVTSLRKTSVPQHCVCAGCKYFFYILTLSRSPGLSRCQPCLWSRCWRFTVNLFSS